VAAVGGRAARAFHDDVMRNAPRLKSLVGCSPLDNVYNLNLEPSGKVRHGKISIDFDQIIGPGMESLLDDSNVADLVTTKLVTLLTIAPGIGMTTSSAALGNRFRAHVQMMRWRNQQGIRQMAALTPAHLRKYQEDMRYGLDSLLPLTERAAAYVDQLLDRRQPLPTYTDGTTTRLAWRQIARALGLTEGNGLPGRTRVAILEYLRIYDPTIYGREIKRLKLADLDDSDDPITEARASILLSPWEALWEFRSYLSHDALTFSPFSTETRAAVARSIGREVDMTEDIPPEQACHLIEHAMRWVLEHGDRIVDLFEKAVPTLDREYTSNSVRQRNVRQNLERLIKKARLPVKLLPIFQTNHFHSKSAGKAVSLRSLVYDLLIAACFILIATFTARRKGELESLECDCLEYDEDGAWIASWIEKTLRDLDRTPVPACVERAIKLLLRIDAVTKAKRKDTWLFRMVEPSVSNRILGFNPSEAINYFAITVGVPPLPDSTYWRFSCHQFRRFFAIAYFWRLRFPSLTALSAHFRHFNNEMTLRYLKGLVHGKYLDVLEDGRASARAVALARKAQRAAKARQKDFEDYAKVFVAERFKSALTGHDWIGGAGGIRLMQELRKRIVDKIGPIAIVPETLEVSAEVNQVIFDFANEVLLTPDRRGCSFCTFGSSTADPHAARCLMKKARAEGLKSIEGARGPDKSYAEDLDCAGCALGVQFRETVAYWKSATTAESQLSRKGSTAGIRKSAKSRLKAIVHRLKEWGII
jgi:hypothetical protein